MAQIPKLYVLVGGKRASVENYFKHHQACYTACHAFVIHNNKCLCPPASGGTSILVGMVSLVSEILVPSKTAKFPFRPMDYSPWSSKNLINRNQPKKFMQIEVDVTCMHTNFGGRGLFGFGDIGTFKNGQFSLSTHGL